MRLLAQERGPDLVGDKRHLALVLNVSALHDGYLNRHFANRHRARRKPYHIEERFRHGAARPLAMPPAARHLVRGIKLSNDPIQGREVYVHALESDVGFTYLLGQVGAALEEGDYHGVCHGVGLAVSQ